MSGAATVDPASFSLGEIPSGPVALSGFRNEQSFFSITLHNNAVLDMRGADFSPIRRRGCCSTVLAKCSPIVEKKQFIRSKIHKISLFSVIHRKTSIVAL